MGFSLTNHPFPIAAMLELYGSEPGTGWEYDRYSGTTLSLTYSYSTTSNASFRSIYGEAIAELSSFLNVSFTRLADEAPLPSEGGYQPDFNADASADLRLSQQYDGTRLGGYHELWYWSNDADYDQEDIDATNRIWSVNHATIFHELGHALSLAHPSANQSPQNTTLLPAHQQNNNYTVMHYNVEHDGNAAEGEWDYRHFQLFDVYALQLRFGANQATHAGNTSHTAASLGMDGWLRVLWDAGGADTINMSAETRSQQIDLRAGTFSDVGAVAGNNPAGDNLAVAIGAVIEHAFGGAGADTITGNNIANTLRGYGGVDTIAGLGGNDILSGGSGNDTANGGEGNDRFQYSGTVSAGGYDAVNGGNGTDTAVALASNTAIGLRSFSGMESFSANGFTNVWIRGSTGNNIFNFTGVALDGVWVDGGAGNDTITMASYDGELLGGSGDDILTGGGLDALIDGQTGNDVINGGDGNDILVGADGLDELTGGLGQDDFRFYFPTGGVDQITDFASGVDDIALSGTNFAHTTQIALVQGAAPTATTANSTFLYNRNTGTLFYDADGTGSGAAVQLATLDTGLTLAVTDFLFF